MFAKSEKLGARRLGASVVRTRTYGSMNRSRFTDSDWFWWLVSVVVGVGASWGSAHALSLSGAGRAGPGLLVLGVILFAGPGVVGYLRPERPWRWAVAFLLAMELTNLLSFRGFERVAELLLFLPIRGTVWAAPALAGAYLVPVLGAVSR